MITFNRLSFDYSLATDFSFKLSQFEIQTGSRVFIEGPSGSGKTTFLNLMVGLLHPQEGSITVLGTDITRLSMSQLDRFRADHFGIIFQLFNLLPYLSVLDNICLPCIFSNVRKNRVFQQHKTLVEAARYLCADLDIPEALLACPVQQLSIGQQQRVAIARALIGQPEIIIADEPTSALDNVRKAQFMTLLLRECQKYNMTLLFVSHDDTLKSHFEECYHLNTLNEGSLVDANRIV